jgi:hypothetical protein
MFNIDKLLLLAGLAFASQIEINSHFKSYSVIDRDNLQKKQFASHHEITVNYKDT